LIDVAACEGKLPLFLPGICPVQVPQIRPALVRWTSVVAGCPVIPSGIGPFIRVVAFQVYEAGPELPKKSETSSS
jgi:hypothetical protein